MADWDLPRDPLAALRDGDPGPFEAFVRSHARVLLGFFRRQGAGLQEAEDLTQQVFLKLFAHAPRYRAQERFPAYCLRVARNVWIDACRRRAARGGAPVGGPEVAEDVASPGDALGPGEAASLREESARLRLAVAGLPEGQREVFELGALQGLPYPEISGLLGIPVGTVKSRMFHAVRKLRRAVGDEGEEGAA